MRKYKGIDIGRLVFACLIPILHIGFSGTGIEIARQYVSRLGVPFFFVVAGMFLIKSIEKKGGTTALKQYTSKIGRMLLIWLVIYLPILLMRQERVTVQEILFKTPAFLWYLTGLLIASVPFCLFRNRTVLLYIAIVLYIVGTIFSESYKWLIGGFPAYESIFLTTRNGFFFGLPLMCVGEQTWKRKSKSILRFVLFGSLLIAEITLVGLHTLPVDDRSMYFFLPLFMFELVLLFREWNPKINTQYCGAISSAIYLMQFGIITVVMKAGEIIGVQSLWIYIITWFCVCIVPTVFYVLLRKTKIVRILF